LRDVIALSLKPNDDVIATRHPLLGNYRHDTGQS